MKQKKLSICLILVLVLQFLVPVGMIAFSTASERNLQENGTVYKMEIRIYSVTNGILYFELTDEEISAHMPYAYFEYDATPNNYVYFIMGTDANGKDCFVNCVTERPSNDLPYMRVNPKHIESLTQYELPSTVPDYYPPRQIEESALHLFVDDYRQQDAVAAQKWYLHLLVYQGKFEVKGIFDENGNPVETQLPKLILANRHTK